MKSAPKNNNNQLYSLNIDTHSHITHQNWFFFSSTCSRSFSHSLYLSLSIPLFLPWLYLPFCFILSYRRFQFGPREAEDYFVCIKNSFIFSRSMPFVRWSQIHGVEAIYANHTLLTYTDTQRLNGN